MKKLILIITMISLFAVVFVGCARKERFDIDACVEELKEQGLSVNEHSTEGNELALAEAKINMEIGIFNGNFSVNLKSYTVLVKGSSDGNNCRIIEFESDEQANLYGGLYMNNRGDNSAFKVAIIENTVIITNLEVVQKNIDAIFK